MNRRREELWNTVKAFFFWISRRRYKCAKRNWQQEAIILAKMIYVCRSQGQVWVETHQNLDQCCVKGLWIRVQWTPSVEKLMRSVLVQRTNHNPALWSSHCDWDKKKGTFTTFWMQSSVHRQFGVFTVTTLTPCSDIWWGAEKDNHRGKTLLNVFHAAC